MKAPGENGRAKERPTAPRIWRWALVLAAIPTVLFFLAAIRVFVSGTGVQGLGNGAPWGLSRVGYLYWIGVAQTGMLLSAVIFLQKKGRRTEICRLAETISLAALPCAVLFFLLGLGRPRLVWRLFPLSKEALAGLNFRSPYLLEFYALCAFAVLSLVYLRGDRRRSGFLTATALVILLVIWAPSAAGVSLQSASMTTFLLAGSLLGGTAMLALIAALADAPADGTPGARWPERSSRVGTLNKLVLAAGVLMGHAYLVGNLGKGAGEPFAFTHGGPDGWTFRTAALLCVALPQLFWFKRCRESLRVTAVAAIPIGAGVWLDRLSLVLPGGWVRSFTGVDIILSIGGFGLFFTLLLLFRRYPPTSRAGDAGRVRFEEAEGDSTEGRSEVISQ